MVANPVKSGCQLVIRRNIPTTVFFVINLIKFHGSEHADIHDAFIITFPAFVIDAAMLSAICLKQDAAAFGTLYISFWLALSIFQRLDQFVSDVWFKTIKHYHPPWL